MSHPSPQPPENHPPTKRFSLGTLPLDNPISHSSSKNTRPWKLRLALLLFIIVMGGALGLTILGARFTQSLQLENKPISFFEGIRLVGQGILTSHTPVRGEEDGRINILLLGRAGSGKPGKHLTDTVMLLSLNLEKKKVALLSFPRDLLVPFPQSQEITKINTLYQYGQMRGQGADVIKASVSMITGLPVHYFASIDFDGFEQVIDVLGGINIEIPRDILDTRYPGPNYSYETFELKKGWQKLDGKTALKYARVRHGDPEGDFGRAKRQQQILQAVREKAWALPTLLNPITLTQLLESLGESLTTDITPEVGRRLMELGSSFDTKNITTTVVDAWQKESLLRVTHVPTQTGQAFALVPRSGTWTEVQMLAKNIFDETNTLERRKAIEAERATLLLVTSPQQATLAESLRQDIQTLFPVKSVSIKIVSGLEKEPETAIIQAPGSSQKLFTLDSLLGRYDLERRETLPIKLPRFLPETDFLIFYTRDTIPGLIHEAPNMNESEDFQEPFIPIKP